MRRASGALLSLLIVLALMLAVWEMPVPAVDMTARVVEHLPVSGVSHPVTAVLLNFRGYDTLLEIAVLLVAVVGGLALRDVQPDHTEPHTLTSPLLGALMHGLVPLMVLVAGYLLWAGGHRPGGAFQAGAVLAATGVLLRLTGVSLPGAGPVALRVALLGGFVVFLMVATGALVGERHLLSYPPAWAGSLILAIEATLSISIGFILLSLFATAPPAPRQPRRRP